MKIVGNVLSLSIAILFLLAHCDARTQKAPPHKFSLPEITCIDARLPITFSWIDFEQPAKKVPAVVLKKIQELIIDFYLETGGDSTEGYTKSKDGYYNTLRIPYNGLQLFIVILKTPMSYTHSKIFLYDEGANAVSKNSVDYNIWAMYSIDDNNNLVRSNLFKSLQLNRDDIVTTKKSDLLLRRIKHNGTTNELEEITLYPNGLSLDTVSFKSKVLYDK